MNLSGPGILRIPRGQIFLRAAKQNCPKRKNGLFWHICTYIIIKIHKKNRDINPFRHVPPYPIHLPANIYAAQFLLLTPVFLCVNLLVFQNR